MVPTVRVDDEVMEGLKNRAVALGLVFGTPNEVLRHILELTTAEASSEAPSDRGRQMFPSSKIPGLQEILEAMRPTLEKLSPRGFYLDSTGKWVGSPDNFVTVRVQETRKKDLAITVYGKPVDFETLNPRLEIRGDRPSYSRFNISSRDDVPDALQIIEHGFGLKEQRRRLRR